MLPLPQSKVVTMGSYGDRWLRCTWCDKSGKCLAYPPANVASLMDVAGIGVLCDPCYERTWPPHYDKVEMLLAKKLDATENARRIAEFAYAPCAEYAESRAQAEKNKQGGEQQEEG
jgi:hypothetical protein